MVRLITFLALLVPVSTGCVMVEVGVTNPVAGLTTVAVAPFFNISQERAVDGRRFAMAYYTELQKTPGFQVIPVGVVEQAMFDHRLEMNNPEDVLRLAQLLNADAVVVGAVTDYSPYYPPRIGLQVSWYSPRPWQFYPGIPVDELARDATLPQHQLSLFKQKGRRADECPPGAAVMVAPAEGPPIVPRGQSPDTESPGRARTISLPEFLLYGEEGAPRQVNGGQPDRLILEPVEPGVRELVPPGPAKPAAQTPTVPLPVVVAQDMPFDPRQPLMSYTRMFDGSDAKLTARLRDYLELSGDLRAGGWEAYLYRSEDFIRFTSHVMIVEMLQLHGGEARKRIVFKPRKYR